MSTPTSPCSSGTTTGDFVTTPRRHCRSSIEPPALRPRTGCHACASTCACHSNRYKINPNGRTSKEDVCTFLIFDSPASTTGKAKRQILNLVSPMRVVVDPPSTGRSCRRKLFASTCSSSSSSSSSSSAPVLIATTASRCLDLLPTVLFDWILTFLLPVVQARSTNRRSSLSAMLDEARTILSPNQLRLREVSSQFHGAINMKLQDLDFLFGGLSLSKQLKLCDHSFRPPSPSPFAWLEELQFRTMEVTDQLLYFRDRLHGGGSNPVSLPAMQLHWNRKYGPTSSVFTRAFLLSRGLKLVVCPRTVHSVEDLAIVYVLCGQDVAFIAKEKQEALLEGGKAEEKKEERSENEATIHLPLLSHKRHAASNSSSSTGAPAKRQRHSIGPELPPVAPRVLPVVPRRLVRVLPFVFDPTPPSSLWRKRPSHFKLFPVCLPSPLNQYIHFKLLMCVCVYFHFGIELVKLKKKLS